VATIRYIENANEFLREKESFLFPQAKRLILFLSISSITLSLILLLVTIM